MPTEIKMPQLGESVTEGTIGRWLKRPGEHVEKYEPLLEVTTDKVDTEVPSPEAGILSSIAVPEGQTVKVGTLLAVLDGAGGADAATVAASNGHAPSTVQVAASNTEHSSGAGGFVSPVVARLVAEHGLDLGNIRGTGQGGRVTKQDVLKYVEAQAQAAPTLPPAPAAAQLPLAMPVPSPALPPPVAVAPAAPVPAAYPDDAEIIPVTGMRRSIAEHMVLSRRTAPHVTTVFEVDVSRIVAHRQRRRADFERQGVKLTFTPYFVQAAVAGLQAVPMVNSSYAESGITLNQRIHIGVAVALEEGLIVPVLRDADEKNLLGLSRAVNDLSERARTRRLKPDETRGGTFTITNHGVSGSLFATPIINQPQAAIMGVGAIQKRPVVISHNGTDAIAIRSMCYVSLTIDHRLLDGAMADRFLSVVKAFIEDFPEE